MAAEKMIDQMSNQTNDMMSQARSATHAYGEMLNNLQQTMKNGLAGAQFASAGMDHWKRHMDYMQVMSDASKVMAEATYHYLETTMKTTMPQLADATKAVAEQTENTMKATGSRLKSI